MPHISITVLWICLILGLMHLAKTVSVFMLHVIVGQYDQHFISQCFYFIFLKLFHGSALYMYLANFVGIFMLTEGQCDLYFKF